MAFCLQRRSILGPVIQKVGTTIKKIPNFLKVTNIKDRAKPLLKKSLKFKNIPFDNPVSLIQPPKLSQIKGGKSVKGSLKGTMEKFKNAAKSMGKKGNIPTKLVHGLGVYQMIKKVLISSALFGAMFALYCLKKIFCKVCSKRFESSPSVMYHHVK